MTGLAGAILLGLGVGGVWLLGRALNLLSPVLWPLAIAGVLAYLLDPVVDFLVARRIPRPRAVLLVFLAVLLALGAVIGSIVPQAYAEAHQFGERLPGYSRKLQERFEGWAHHPPTLVRKAWGLRRLFGPSTSAPAPTNGLPGTDPAPSVVAPAEAPADASGIPRDLVQPAAAWIARWLPAAGNWLVDRVGRVGSWLGMLAGACLVPVYLFYLLVEKPGIQRGWTDYLPLRPSRFKDELVFCLRAINDYLIVFFRGQVLVALSNGVLYTLGFVLIDLPYAFLLGLLAVPLTMIPMVGAVCTCVAAVLVAVVATANWQLPALVLGVVAVVQAIEGLVVAPKILGDRVGLHPLTILIAVMVGTTLLGGLLGGILAIPLTAALRVILFRYLWRRADPVPEVAGG